MLATPTAAVSSALTTLPAFETEHALFIAEQALARPLGAERNSCARSAALQGVADAYAARRAGDRGDNLTRAAALLARAASLPATLECEKALHAAALSRLARTLLARAAIPQRHAFATEPEEDASTEKGLPRMPSCLRLVHVPDARVSRVAQKALLAASAAAESIAANNTELRKLKDILDKRDEAAESEKKELDKVELSGELSPLRNLLAALHVDQARALFLGATLSNDSNIDVTQQVKARVKAAIKALKLAAKLRTGTNRRERTAGALADTMLATLYSREKAAAGKELSEDDRVRAARLLIGAAACLNAVFGGGEASDSDSGSGSDSSAVSDSPPASPRRAPDDFVQGSDCSEESLGRQGSPNKDKEKDCVRAPPQDAFEPFLGWDLEDVRRFIDDEIKRLGPVMQDGAENRRSCVMC